MSLELPYCYLNVSRLIEYLILFFLQQFRKLNQGFMVIEIDERPDCLDIQSALGQMTGESSVQ